MDGVLRMSYLLQHSGLDENSSPQYVTGTHCGLWYSKSDVLYDVGFRLYVFPSIMILCWQAAVLTWHVLDLWLLFDFACHSVNKAYDAYDAFYALHSPVAAAVRIEFLWQGEITVACVMSYAYNTTQGFRHSRLWRRTLSWTSFSSPYILVVQTIYPWICTSTWSFSRLKLRSIRLEGSEM